MKQLRLYSSLVAWTVAVYLVLYILGINNIEPVRFTALERPSGRPHTTVVPSPVGLAIWLAVVATYGAICGLLGRLMARYSVRRSLSLALLVTVGTVTYISVVHPLALAVYLPSQVWEKYSQASTSLLPVLDRIYYHFGLPELLIPVLVVQVLYTVACAFAVERLWNPSRARAALERVQRPGTEQREAASDRPTG